MQIAITKRWEIEQQTQLLTLLDYQMQIMAFQIMVLQMISSILKNMFKMLEKINPFSKNSLELKLL